MNNWVSPWDERLSASSINDMLADQQRRLAEVDRQVTGRANRPTAPDCGRWWPGVAVQLGMHRRPTQFTRYDYDAALASRNSGCTFPGAARTTEDQSSVCCPYRQKQVYLADPGLLDDEVWRLFEVPGAARELAKCDGTWEQALATLSERGLLDRSRLLDACLDAFFKDFASSQVGWYATFHNRMAPTLDEVAARTGKYLALLATNSAHCVSLAQQACDRLLTLARPASPLAEFLAASPPCCCSRRRAERDPPGEAAREGRR